MSTSSILQELEWKLYMVSQQKKVQVICDWDEVIQNLESYLLRQYIEKGFYSEAFEKVISQEDKNIILNGGSVFKPIIPLGFDCPELMEIFHSDDLYNNLPLTIIPFFLRDLVEKGIVSEVVFFTHIPRQYETDNRKKNLFKILFGNNPKFHFLALRWVKPNMPATKKGKIISDLFPDFTLFIDDNPEFIIGAGCYFAGDTSKLFFSPTGVRPNKTHMLNFLELNNLGQNIYISPLNSYKSIDEFLNDTALA